MTAAQVALAALVAVLIAGATVLFVVDENGPGWVFAGAGLFGFVMLMGMVATDRNPRT